MYAIVMAICAGCAATIDNHSTRLDSLYEKVDWNINDGACQTALQELIKISGDLKVNRDIYRNNKKIAYAAIQCGEEIIFRDHWWKIRQFQFRHAESAVEIAINATLETYFAKLITFDLYQAKLLSLVWETREINYELENLKTLLIQTTPEIETLGKEASAYLQSKSKVQSGDYIKYFNKIREDENNSIEETLIKTDMATNLNQTIAIEMIVNEIDKKPLLRSHLKVLISTLIKEGYFQDFISKLTVPNAIRLMGGFTKINGFSNKERNILYQVGNNIINKWNLHNNGDVKGVIPAHIARILQTHLLWDTKNHRNHQTTVIELIKYTGAAKLNWGNEFLIYISLSRIKNSLSESDIKTLISNIVRHRQLIGPALGVRPETTKVHINALYALEYFFKNNLAMELKHIKEMFSQVKTGSEYPLTFEGVKGVGETIEFVEYFSSRLTMLDPNSKLLASLSWSNLITSKQDSDLAIELGYAFAIQARKASQNFDLSTLWRQKSERVNRLTVKLLYQKFVSFTNGSLTFLPSPTYEDLKNTLSSRYAIKTQLFSGKLNTPKFLNHGVDFDSIEKLIANDEVLIVYSELDHGLWIQFIAKGMVSTKWIPSSSLVFVEELGRSVKDRGDINLIKQLSKSFTDLIDDQGIMISHSNATFLGRGTIWGVPTTLLWNSKNDQWLIESININNFYNINHFVFARDIPIINKPSNLIGFANPTFTSQDSNGVILDHMIRSKLPDSVSLTPLPETEIELAALARVHSGSSKSFIANEATFVNLNSVDLDNVFLLSISTHGLLSGELEGIAEPSIALTPTKEHSGFVTSTDLFSLKGVPQVVFLLTCNSAIIQGQMQMVEIQSLSDAFAAKGAKYVLSSLWAVDSIGTTQLVDLIANGLEQGLSYESAHNRAIRGLIESTKFNHPNIWSAFTGIGRGQRPLPY